MRIFIHVKELGSLCIALKCKFHKRVTPLSFVYLTQVAIASEHTSRGDHETVAIGNLCPVNPGVRRLRMVLRPCFPKHMQNVFFGIFWDIQFGTACMQYSTCATACMVFRYLGTSHHFGMRIGVTVDLSSGTVAVQVEGSVCEIMCAAVLVSGLLMIHK